MGGLFNYDNLIMTWLRKIMNMMLVSLMWVIGCLPIFTIGASTSALYYTVHKNLKYERGYAGSEFWKGFKASFKQATLVWLVLLGLALVFAGDVFILNGFAEAYPIFGTMTIIFYILLLLELVYCIYVFPYIARFNAGTKVVVKNCFVLMIRHLLFSILALVIVLLGAFFVWLLPILLLLIPALVLWQISFFMEKLYRRYMTEEEKQQEDERNRLQF